MKFSDELKSRFLANIKSSSNDECWIWSGYKNPAGYGHSSIKHKTIYAHRLSYMLFVGQIPDNYKVCHKCDNPSCVNPAHLFVGTQLDNIRDRDKKSRKTWPTGESNPNAKLTDSEVSEIRKLKSETNVTTRKLAKRFGVSAGYISLLCRGIRRGTVLP